MEGQDNIFAHHDVKGLWWQLFTKELWYDVLPVQQVAYEQRAHNSLQTLPDSIWRHVQD
jgi:hypothetical protein